MTTLRNILAGFLTLAMAFGAGYLLRGCSGSAEGPVIEKEGPIREKIVYKPANCDDAWKCYYAALFIQAQFKKKDILSITAGNMCKTATQDFRVTCPDLSVPNHWQLSPIILAGYDPSIKRVDVLAGGSLGYIKGMGRVGLGMSGIYLRGLIGGGSYGGASIILQY